MRVRVRWALDPRPGETLDHVSRVGEMSPALELEAEARDRQERRRQATLALKDAGPEASAAKPKARRGLTREQRRHQSDEQSRRMLELK